MNKAFVERLTEYLDSECSDYDMSYDYEWIEDSGYCEVNIKRYERLACLKIMYNEKHNDLQIELSEDCYFVTREFDETVKYFWMLVSPALFPEE